MNKLTENEEGDEFWDKGVFYQSMSSTDLNEKKKTINKKNTEDMNYNCKKCNQKISAHNKDWHNAMCDNCFNKEFFPDTNE